MSTYYCYEGTASWYDCTTGPLACTNQPCPPSSGGFAYPNVVGHPPDYAASCGGVVALPCFTYVSLSNLCAFAVVASQVIDHGPGAACMVDNLPCVINTPAGPYFCGYRFVDLTALTFMNLGGKLYQGILAAQLEVIV